MPRTYTRRYSPEERFWCKVDPCRTDGCALWLGVTNGSGYGQFWLNGKMTYAHHFLVGLPPKGLEWDHVRELGCSHRNCAWPEHLELVTHRENTLRGNTIPATHALKTHCPQGHAYDEPNTRVSNGKRYCRACAAARMARKRRQKVVA